MSAEVICIKEHAGRGAHFGNAFLVPDRANVEKNNTNKIKGNVVNGAHQTFRLMEDAFSQGVTACESEWQRFGTRQKD